MSDPEQNRWRNVARPHCSASGTASSRASCCSQPGKFGLGKIPAKLAPDATTTMVCGYCSTGCGLKVHLQERRGDQPYARRGVSRQPRHGVPEGLGSARRVLDSPERATTPLVRDRAPATLQPVELGRGADHVLPAVSGDHARARPGVGRLSQHRADSDRRNAAPRLPGEVRHGLAARRQQHAAVHGDVRRRLQAIVRLRRPALHLRRLRRIRRASILVGSNLCIGHPILWERVLRNPHQPKIIVIDPRRTETAMAATQHLPLAPKSDLALFYGLAKLLIERGWIDRDFHRPRTPAASRTFASSSRRSRSSASPPRRAWPPSDDRVAGRDDSRRASESRSGGRWASTRATRESARPRASSIWP